MDCFRKRKKRKWLIQLIDDSEVLWSASSGGHAEIIQLLLDAGATPLPPPFTRGSEDQIGIHTDQKCNEGHGLIRFNTPSVEYGCDICARDIPKETVAYGCEKCDYDICTSCEKQ